MVREPLYYFSMILHSLCKIIDGNDIRLEETLYFNTLSELMQSLYKKMHISKALRY